jgi:hypothetical protein
MNFASWPPAIGTAPPAIVKVGPAIAQQAQWWGYHDCGSNKFYIGTFQMAATF